MIICSFAQCYNELKKGNLHRWLQNTNKYADLIAVYDDGSTDGSQAILEKQVDIFIRGEKNDFMNETKHRAELLQKCLEIYPEITHFIWTDVDEVLDANATKEIRTFLETAKGEAYELEGINLWRSECWRRLDYIPRFSQIAIWKNTGKLHLPISYGLHSQLHPTDLAIEKSPFTIIHYGYSTAEQIASRWVTRTRLGVPKQWRERCIDESHAVFEHIPHEIFPKGCEPKECKKPTPISYIELIKKLEQ